MKVCIAEKPSVAQTIANVLGATTKHQGYFEVLIPNSVGIKALF